MSLKEEVIRLIIEGYSEPEIREKVGLKSGGYTYQIAKSEGLRLTPARERRDNQIKELRERGLSYAEIARQLSITETTVYDAIKRLGLQSTKTVFEDRICHTCGAVYKPIRINQKYCCAACERKAERIRQKNNPHADDSYVPAMVERTQPDWEYVGGYTGSDGRMDLRHKVCGTVVNQSSISVRKRKHLSCPHCTQEAQQRKKNKKIAAKIVRRINEPAKKTEQIQMRTCPECGAFYFSSNEYCHDCTVKNQKRLMNRKKDLKRRNSQTKESKLISARTLYKRDNGICWICGGICDINADPNSDLYPSVDHILPQSLGGKDTLDNVRLAHRICNTLRSNNVNFIPPVSAISLS